MLSPHKSSVALMGVGGYGFVYVNSLLNQAMADQNGAQLIAAVEPNPNAGESLRALKSAGVPVYATAEEMYGRHQPEVVVLASPIQFHAQQTIQALANGCHVLCEKPLSGNAEQAVQMKRAKDRSASQVAIGYQWSFSRPIQRLKTDILNGLLGAPLRCKAIVLWPRDEVYYTRNNWAGRKYSPAGQPIFDSPLNNACAHFLHNLLYLLGPQMDRSARPESVTAELYRANAIETFDTSVVCALVNESVELLTIVSHATESLHEPTFEMEFEHATVAYSDQTGGRLVVYYKNGRVEDYGRLSTSSDPTKLWSSIDAFRNGTPVACGIEAAAAQTIVIDAVHRSMPDAVKFPETITEISGPIGQRKTVVRGLDTTLRRCYAEWTLPSEMDVEWAVAGLTILPEHTELLGQPAIRAMQKSPMIHGVPVVAK